MLCFDSQEAAVSSNEVPFGGPGAAKQSNDAFNGITEEPPEISTSDLDRQILKLWFPAILNLVLIPLVGAVDVFWVGHMNNAITLAGMGAANQVRWIAL